MTCTDKWACSALMAQAECCKGCMPCILGLLFYAIIMVLILQLSEPSPSTMIVALDIPELPLEHSTNDWLFSDVTLWIVKLVGLANGTSIELTWGIFSPTLSVNSLLWPGILRSTVQSTLPELLLQVNITFPLSGTTYPPGIDTASADRVTVKAIAAL